MSSDVRGSVVPEIPELPVQKDIVPPEDYLGDPITISDDGHFVGEDGFVVPKDFNEFYERFPNYIPYWVKKRLHKFTIDEDVEDWTQDLIIHLKYLPATSKHRKAGANFRPNGCQDVIETFNPYQQYGASERRFRAYVNFCLANKFNTVQGKRVKNPVCRYGNVSLGQSAPLIGDPTDNLLGSDEFIHHNSEYLSEIRRQGEKHQDDRLFVLEFIRFVEEEDPTMIPVIEAIGKTGTQNEAAAYLRDELGVDVPDEEFVRYRNRLRQLGDCFIDWRHASKPRRPYKKREPETELDTTPPTL
jgi:hypothetical protein